MQALLEAQISYRRQLVLAEAAPENQSAPAHRRRERREIHPTDLRTVLEISRHDNPVQVNVLDDDRPDRDPRNYLQTPLRRTAQQNKERNQEADKRHRQADRQP